MTGMFTAFNDQLEVDNLKRDVGYVTDEHDINFGAFENPAEAIGMGIAHGGATLLNVGLMAQSVYPILYDKVSGDTKAQDWYFKNVQDTIGKTILDATNFDTPEKGYIDNVLFGLSDILTRAATTGIGGLTASEFGQVSQERIDEGKDLSTAYELGGVGAGVMALGGSQAQIAKSLLKLVGKEGALTYGKAAALGAVGNVGINVAAIPAEKAILESGGYSEEAQAMQYTGTQFLTDLIIGGVFGAFDGAGKKEMLVDGKKILASKLNTTAKQDSVLGAVAQDITVNEINPLVRDTPNEQVSDRAAQDSALMSVIKSEPVNAVTKLAEENISVERIQSGIDSKVENVLGIRQPFETGDIAEPSIKAYDPIIDDALYSSNPEPFLEARGDEKIVVDGQEITLREHYENETADLTQAEDDVEGGMTALVKCLFGAS